ncbi:alpha/beta fold hydrolase [Flagellimonas hymeniacidonis]|uniref:Alpha/beta fold hydrolase n=2 Tax=Flagellimonas hymeniacidonis TaxID=2603628 RepID=A0A5C8VCA7_9FLAO|nr:alpha/beta fold hydrolase [Flagellimonas hymeniacidonis]
MKNHLTISSQSFSISSEETFNNTWPYKPHFKEIAGFKMHYVDEGQGEVILALHGESTWGYLFRHLIASLSSDHRVIVPDHMGFGKSETPQDRSYLLQDHIENLEQFVLDLDLKGITLVMHDFGGPVGMGLAIRHPNRIKRIISTNGPTPLGQPGLVDALMKNGATSPWFSWIFKAYEKGILEQVLGQLDYNILSTLKLNGFENNDLITETWLQAYRTPFKTPEHTLGAIGWAKGFAEGAHQFEPVEAVTAKELSKKPALAIWGMADKTLQPEHFLPLFSEAFPNGKIHRLEGVGHYSLEDAPGEIALLIKAFLKN